MADAPTWVADAPADWAAVVMSLWAAAAPMGRDSFMDLLNLRVFSRYYYQELRTMIWELRDPLGRFLLGAILWLAVAVVWISRRVARGVTVKRLSKQKAAPLAYWRRWLVTPVVFGITVLLCRSTLPAWAGFWISKPWMESAVEEARIAAGRTATAGGAGWPGAATPDRWIGIYPPSPTPTWGGQVQWHRGEATVHVSNNARRNPMGYFVYRNDGRAPELMPFGVGAYSTTNRVRHLYGPWYVVEMYPYGER